MDDLHRKPEEQLNIPDDVDFTIDDIVREFGSGAQKEEPAPEAPEVLPVAEELPEEPEVPVEELVRIWSPKEKPAAPQKDPVAAEDEATEVLREYRPASRPAVPKMPLPEEEPEEREIRKPRMRPVVLKPPEKSREETAEDYGRKAANLRSAVTAAWIAAALSAVMNFVALDPFLLGMPQYIPAFLAGIGSTLLLLLHCFLALPVLKQGVLSLLHRRFTAKTYLAVASVVLVLQSIFASAATGNLAAAGSFLLTVGLWGEYLRTCAKRQTLDSAMRMQKPVAVARMPGAWNEKDCLGKREADTSALTEDLEQTPGAEKWLGAIMAILFAATLALAVVLHQKADRNFLWAWSVLLIGACPLGGMLAYGRAFCLGAKRLQVVGAALAGWNGALRMSGSVGAVITDENLFGPAHLTLNGIKVFGTFSAERLLGYASAILERSGTKSISKMFSDALAAQNGRRFRTDYFRTYEAGGLGGEIQGDVVLLGSFGFMQTMGVKFPENVKMKQALYISVDGEVAGVFALNYQASGAVKAALAALMSSRGLSPILATRDTMLTPAMVRQKFKLPADRLEYPVSKQRAELSETAAKGDCAAFLAKDRFLNFAVAICTGRQLRRSVPSAIASAVFGAVLGLLLMVLLVLTGAVAAANACNLMLYHMLWLIPVAVISGRVGK